ncbi:trafficking protein particle complex subunit 3 isoform X5 [Helianthus annuus]|uniref:trafficking protein particle complex subunit 3 isoform X5 n=1 Tax=Helianthus annuus TaxID=4232 RepID=UPI000B90583B|nr:trafficking protein particle complex subunit 3 isoform X5 [Helianthus annuus]
MAPVVPRSGDAIFANFERVNAELFTLTYGAIVRQLLTDLEEVEEVNKQLDQMGYNIGIRLIDEFLAKSNVTRCVDFRETAEVIAKMDMDSDSIKVDLENGSTTNLDLEDDEVGSVEVSMKTEVTWVRDMLRGDDAFEFQVKLLKQVPEEYPYKDDE